MITLDRRRRYGHPHAIATGKIQTGELGLSDLRNQLAMSLGIRTSMPAKKRV